VHYKSAKNKGGLLVVKISNLKVMGQRNRYYRLRRVILSGVPEYSSGRWDRFHIVEISMRGTRESLIQRNRDMKIKLAKAGLKYESCFCAPVEAVDGWHKLKGLVRLEKAMSGARLETVLQEAWEKGREVKVEVKMWAELELRKYIREEILGDVGAGKYAGQHLAMSRGWRLEIGAVSGSEWFRIDGQGKVVVKEESSGTSPLTSEC